MNRLPTGLLNTREAAAYYGVSPGTMANWRSSGGGPTFNKLGDHRVGYRVSDLDAHAVSARNTAEARSKLRQRASS